MKALPYFKWYPSDAKADELYCSMSDEELGFFHRCLNHSWDNFGLPSDMEDLARLMHVTRENLDRLWVKVGRGFHLTDTIHPRWINKRQEEERDAAIQKSRKATDSVRTRYGKSTNVDETKLRNVYERSENVALRTYESESESESENISSSAPIPFPRQKCSEPKPSARFQELLARWPRKTGIDSAAMDWCSVVTVENEAEVFACANRYLESMEVAEGKVRNLGSTMDKPGWLIDCARDKWACEWPRVRDPPRSGIAAMKTKQQQQADDWANA